MAYDSSSTKNHKDRSPAFGNDLVQPFECQSRSTFLIFPHLRSLRPPIQSISSPNRLSSPTSIHFWGTELSVAWRYWYLTPDATQNKGEREKQNISTQYARVQIQNKIYSKGNKLANKLACCPHPGCNRKKKRFRLKCQKVSSSSLASRICSRSIWSVVICPSLATKIFQFCVTCLCSWLRASFTWIF